MSHYKKNCLSTFKLWNNLNEENLDHFQSLKQSLTVCLKQIMANNLILVERKNLFFTLSTEQ